MSKCKHERVHVFEWAEGDREEDAIRCEQHKCLDCGAWLSLGEANDDDPRVAVEIRAAEIAADDDELMGMCESFGWESLLAPKFSTDPVDDGYSQKWHAGYLARCIATHSEDA